MLFRSSFTATQSIFGTANSGPSLNEQAEVMSKKLDEVKPPVVEAPVVSQPAPTCSEMQHELELRDAQDSYAEFNFGSRPTGRGSERSQLVEQMIKRGC